ncbi:MAG: metal-dependent hydrolase [Pseudonocardia sp.]
MTEPRGRRLRGADVGIPPRQLDFQLPAQLPRWMYADNRTATTYLAVLSAFFPPGEEFFVRSVQRFAAGVTDPVLRARVAGFTAQEVIHGREHDRLNELLRERGFHLEVAEKAIVVALALLERLPARQRLACTAFMEHFTAVLAEETLAAEDAGKGYIHPDLNELWLWHALEELEHKSVSYEVYEKIGNRWPERLLAEPLVLATVGPALVASWVWLLATEGALVRPGDVAEGLKLMFGPGRSCAPCSPSCRCSAAATSTRLVGTPRRWSSAGGSCCSVRRARCGGSCAVPRSRPPGRLRAKVIRWIWNA